MMVLPEVHLKAEEYHPYDAWYYVSYGNSTINQGIWKFITKSTVYMEETLKASKRIYTDYLEYRIENILNTSLLEPIIYQGITYDYDGLMSGNPNTYTIEWKRIIDENGANNAGKDNVPLGIPTYHVDGQVTFNYHYSVEYYFSGIKDETLTQNEMVSFIDEPVASLPYQRFSVDGYVISEVENENLKVGSRENVIKVYYDVDQIGENGPDGIPDKYQAELSFKVEHGQWNDGTSDIIKKVVTFRDQQGRLNNNGEATFELPDVGIYPVDGYKFGQWDRPNRNDN